MRLSFCGSIEILRKGFKKKEHLGLGLDKVRPDTALFAWKSPGSSSW